MATTTTTTDSRVESNVIDFRQVVELVSKCLLVAIILSTSTGPFIRELISITLVDLLTFCVGLLWLLGDILPCMSILLIIHDCFLKSNPASRELILIRGRQVTPLLVIIILFLILYLLDITIIFACYTISYTHKSTTKNCETFLASYRYTFFHIQLITSMIYAIKPWRFSGTSFGKILSDLKNFQLFAPQQPPVESISDRQNLICGLHQSLEPSNDIVAQSTSGASQVADESKIPSEKNVQRKNASTVSKSSYKRTGKSTSRSSKSVSTRQQTKRATNGNSRTVKRPRSGMIVGARRSMARQTVIMQVRRQPSRGGKSLSSKRHSAGCNIDSTRTLNLNLNMN